MSWNKFIKQSFFSYPRFFLSGLVFIYSCSFHSNKIYYDSEKKAIISCDGGTLSRISINSEDNNENYFFKLNDYNTGDEIFYFFKNHEGFTLSNLGVEIPMDSFTLSPNTTYIVDNYSEGHRPSMVIKIKTNSKGEIIEASKTSCE